MLDLSQRSWTFLRLFFLIGIVAWQSSCGGGQQSGCEKHIMEEIHAGVKLEMAEAALKKCGFKTTMDSAKNTLYGDKRVGNGLVIERTQVVVGLNSDNVVATISVTTGLIGP
jgi:hypothetical protein